MNEGSSLAAPSSTTTPAAPSSAPASSQEGSQSSSQTFGQPAPADAPVDMAKVFGEEFTKDPNLAKFKTPGDVLKSYRELQSMAGKPKFDVPTADTPPEQAAEFYKKLGVPETPDAYGLKPDAYRPEANNEANAEFVKAFSQIAHEAKLTPTQAQAVHKFMDGIGAEVDKSMQAEEAKNDQVLSDLFAKALPGENLDVVAQRMSADIEKIIPEEMRTLLAGKMSNEALTAIALMEKHYREKYGQTDSNIGTTQNNAGTSVADLRKQASDLMATPAYQNPMDPGHKAVKERVDALYKTVGELTNKERK